MRIWLTLGLLGLGLPLAAQDTEAEKDQQEKEAEKAGTRFVWKKHPSLRVGNWLRVDFRARLQMDWALRDPETKSTPDLFEIARKRIAIEGNILKIFEYEVSRELGESDNPWRDVYGNVRVKRWFQVRGGRFRIPFSQDQLTGPTNLDFVDRSRLADRLAPNRDTGVMSHGSFFSQTLKYQFGYFFNDGDNARLNNVNLRTGEEAWAARLTYRPLAKKGMFETLTLGAAFVTSQVPEGLYSLRGRTETNETFFPYHFVNGYRRRTGAEFAWIPGSFSLKAEFADVREQRLGQGIRGEDLPDLLARAWYVYGTWVVTGQRKARGLSRGREIPFVGKRPFGIVELAVRTEVLRYASVDSTGNPSRSTRAANILQTSDRAWTFGVNWYINQWVKAQANFTREWIEDSFRAPIQGQNLYWNYKFRLQLAL